MKFKLPKINLSIQLAILFVLTLCFGSYLPYTVKAALFACSTTLKEILLFLLPLIIFVCLFSSMVANQGRAFKFVIVLFTVVCISNFFSIIAAFGAGTLGLNLIPPLSGQLPDNASILQPLWDFKIPAIFPMLFPKDLFFGLELEPNKTALVLGVILGVAVSFFKLEPAIQFGKRASGWVTLFLQKAFVPLLPLFALGFIIKMEHEGVLSRVVGGYAPIILIIFLVCLLYIAMMFAIAARFSWKTWVQYIKNVLPAGFLGFSTMSSLATMPVTLNAAEKNTNDPNMARAIIPATVNIHMIGDSIAIPILGMAILLTFGSSLPTLTECLIFTGFFMVAKFAIPGVPCGSVFVMLPIFEKYLGFTPEMSAFIAAIYILFDPIITATNVLGNSALVIMLTRMMNAFSKDKAVEEEKALQEVQVQ